MKNRRILEIIGALGLVFAACSPAATPTPLPATATATVALPAPTATRAVSPQPSPTPTAPPTREAAGPKRGGAMIGLQTQEIAGWDPHKIFSGPGALRINAGLVFSIPVTWEWPKKGEIAMTLVPDVAETWQWTTPLVLELKLRRGVLFQDKPPVNGREMTAGDVVFSYERFCNYSPRIRYICDNIQEFSAVDRYTVQIRLKSPYSALVPELLAFNFGSILATEAGAGPDKDWSDPVKAWIGTGPFEFENWIPGVKYTFTKNARYWKEGLPRIDRLSLMLVPDMSTRGAMLAGGRLDMAHEIDIATADMLRKAAPQIEINSAPYLSAYINLYVRTDKPPFNDLRVRRALQMALDRQTIVNTVLLGAATPEYVVASHLKPESMSLDEFPPEVRRYLEYHPDESRKLLAEAGYPNGLAVTMVTTAGDNSNITRFSEALPDIVAKAGFKVTLQWLDYARYTSVVVNNSAFDEMAFRRLGQGDLLRWLQERYLSSSPPSRNAGRISDPALDKMIYELSAVVDEDKRLQLWRKVQTYMVEQAYIFLVANGLEYDARQPWVKSEYGHGFALFYIRSFYEKAWLDR